jgi:hypothetical protein
MMAFWGFGVQNYLQEQCQISAIFRFGPRETLWGTLLWSTRNSFGTCMWNIVGHLIDICSQFHARWRDWVQFSINGSRWVRCLPVHWLPGAYHQVDRLETSKDSRNSRSFLDTHGTISKVEQYFSAVNSRWPVLSPVLPIVLSIR